MACGQAVIEKEILLVPKPLTENSMELRLLPAAAIREPGNAAPALLRMTYEMRMWMNVEFPKLNPELAGRDPADPDLQAFRYDSFAPQIIRAGNMSDADWGYPIHGPQPYDILMPDAQMMRYFLGWGMTIWIKQQIAKGDYVAALQGLQAQLSCARHMAATPFGTCYVIGKTITDQSLDSLELLLQQSADVENTYWALAALPRTIGDLSAMTEWETLAFRRMLPSLTEPLPERGSERWPLIAQEFIKMMEDTSYERYDPAEILELTVKLDRVASRFLRDEFGWTDQQLKQATIEERVMRWVVIQRREFDLQTEQMATASIPEALKIYQQILEKTESILRETGSKHDPFSGGFRVVNACLQFHRRVRFLQTIEAIRDHVARNQGQLPDDLQQLKFPAPADPFTGVAFEYRKTGNDAWLSYPPVAADPNPTRSYFLTIKPD